MKSCFVCLCLLLATLPSALAQYLPVFEENKVWTHVLLDTWGLPNVEAFAATYQADTIINGQTYWRRYTTSDSTYQNFELNEYSQGVFREDTVGRVYLYDYFTTEERLLIDFNMTVGDTLPPLVEGDCPAVVTKVDTIIYEDGIERKQIELSLVPYWNDGQLQRTYTWVEGMGNTRYAFGSYYYVNCIIDGTDTPYNCVTRDGVVLYNNPTYPGCFYTATEAPDRPVWSVAPNPTTDLLRLITDRVPTRLELYDINGRRLGQWSHTTRLSLADRAPGVYLLRVWLDATTVVQTRVVRQ